MFEKWIASDLGDRDLARRSRLLNVLTLHLVGRLETKVKELNAPDPSSPDEPS